MLGCTLHRARVPSLGRVRWPPVLARVSSVLLVRVPAHGAQQRRREGGGRRSQNNDATWVAAVAAECSVPPARSDSAEPERSSERERNTVPAPMMGTSRLVAVAARAGSTARTQRPPLSSCSTSCAASRLHPSPSFRSSLATFGQPPSAVRTLHTPEQTDTMNGREHAREEATRESGERGALLALSCSERTVRVPGARSWTPRCGFLQACLVS